MPLLKNLLTKFIGKIAKLFLIRKYLSLKERVIFFAAIILVITGILGIFTYRHISGARKIPTNGGTYREGLLGYPKFINPILGYANDVDRDLIKLIYSGLMRFDAEGNLVPDLAEDFSVQNNGKTYIFYLRKNILWHDNTPLTADDVLFTIKLIQNPRYESPLRFNWEGVSVRKIDDWTIEFSLNTAYALFMTNTTVEILPQHIWQGVSPEDFLSLDKNNHTIGSGSFKLREIKISRGEEIIQQIILEKNDNYYLKKPYLDKLIFNFYNSEASLIDAYKKGEIDGFSLMSSFNQQEVELLKRANIYYPLLPRYFALFFNQSHNILKNKSLRTALAYATNKDRIIKEIFNNEATKIEIPVFFLEDDEESISLPSLEKAQNYDIPVYEYNLTEAQSLIEGAKINPQDISLNLVFPDIPEIKKTAETIRENWQDLGIIVKLIPVAPEDILEQNIKERNYDIILFGQVMSLSPDPFSFWHSSQISHPGLNLSLYKNSDVDKILERIRQEQDLAKRADLYLQLNQKIAQDIPAIFLYSPRFIYVVNEKIKGIRTSIINLPPDRFANIENWYIKMKLY